MPPETSLQAEFSKELKRELHITRRVLERVPTEKFDWRPHPKSMSLGALAGHIANIIGFLEMSLQGPETDLAVSPWPASPTTSDGVLQRFDVNAENIQKALAQVDDETFHAPWTMRRGEQVFMTLPRAAITRNLVLNHLIHHRGQMSVYLRLLDIPVPAIYGGSADEAPRR
ncbi:MULTISPECIES: DinB family protein [Hymenobacter]|uniref:DinB family protein n=1 Tax=Hymenobacter jejuensis TaxID=2502781 RepID=A0A5B7ZU53_9BACT|nr:MULTISPECIES: DinB family protein [Hymenobacter]MBC6989075.1 DinB family protein [Hymenobacter sp. BT491]QDA58714.1 DinB family protein [Hymenobacter jejuensis]